MKKWIWLFLIVLPLHAQENTLTIWASQDDYKAQWTEIAAGGSVTHDFIFSQRFERHGYAGFSAYYAWVDTAAGGAGARDSLKIDAYVLVYDKLSGQHEIGTPALLVSGKDSINVAQYINWGTNHSDDKFTISKVLNVQSADGIRVITSNAGAALKFRDEIKFSNSK